MKKLYILFLLFSTLNPAIAAQLKRCNATAGAMAAAKKAAASSSSAQEAPTTPTSATTPVLIGSPTAIVAPQQTATLSPSSSAPAQAQIKDDAQLFTTAYVRACISNCRKHYWIINPLSPEQPLPRLELLVAADTAPNTNSCWIDLERAFSSFDTHLTKEKAAAEKEGWLKLTANRRYTFWTYQYGEKSPPGHTVFPIAQYTSNTLEAIMTMKGFSITKHRFS